MLYVSRNAAGEVVVSEDNPANVWLKHYWKTGPNGTFYSSTHKADDWKAVLWLDVPTRIRDLLSAQVAEDRRREQNAWIQDHWWRTQR